MSRWVTYKVGQKQGHFTFLLVTNECIYTKFYDFWHICYKQNKKSKTASFLAHRVDDNVHIWITRSSAVAVIADRTANDVRYSYRPLSVIAVVSMSIYLFTVSNWSLLLIRKVLADCCFVAKRWIPHSAKSVWEKWIGSALIGTRPTVQLLTPYTDPERPTNNQQQLCATMQRVTVRSANCSNNNYNHNNNNNKNIKK